MLLDTLKALCSKDGVSGMENEVRDYIKEQAAPYADKIITDNIGNLLIFKKGAAVPKKRLMLAAHMDEVGIIVTRVTDDGSLEFDFVGGVDRRVAIGKRVRINGIWGFIACKAISHAKRSGDENVPKLEDLYVDIGAFSREEAEKTVSLGDIGVFESETIEFGEGFLKAKAIDDRVGCAVLLELIKEELSVDTWFAFTVQEEVGTRGATVASFRLKPEVALIVEGTTAADIPGVPGGKKICSPGKGVVIPFMDRGTLYDRELYAFMTKLCEDNGIKWQTKTMVAGGTDASAVQRSRAGSKVIGIAAALRNIHSPSCVGHTADFEGLLKLSRLFIKSQGE